MIGDTDNLEWSTTVWVSRDSVGPILAFSFLNYWLLSAFYSYFFNRKDDFWGLSNNFSTYFYTLIKWRSVALWNVLFLGKDVGISPKAGRLL